MPTAAARTSPASRPRATRSALPRRKQPQPAPATKDAPPFPRHVVAAEDIPSRLSAILKQAQRHAIGIRKNGKPIAVLLSAEEYEHFERLEDAHWEARLEADQDDEWIGPEASEALIQDIVNAPDED